MTRASRRVHWVMLGLAGSSVALAGEPGAIPVAGAKSLVARVAVPPRFPLSLRGTEHSAGHAIVALTIDPNGRVDDVVTLEASHPAFGTAAEAAVKAWEFEPADASTRPPRDVRQFEFRSAGVIDTLSHMEAAGARICAGTHATAAAHGGVARSSITTDRARLPRAPKLHAAALSRLADRPVIVSFIIDTDGTVRVPVVDAAVDPDIAIAVVLALREWRFTPPRQDGAPVVVQAHRAFGGAESPR